ncbi:MAG: 50S ribosomal protein L6 [Candidatus Kerfeldbacteria bacterium]|nr:50S ribosomal protein L6 [Candidatus Kerfeldbacteria bacterium]
MSRIGKQPIALPTGVTATVHDGTLTVKGSKGELSEQLHSHVLVDVKDSVLNVTVIDPTNEKDRALWGLTRALAANMVKGVTDGFEKKLEINGVGFKAAVQGKKLVLSLGFSHPVEYEFPDGVTIGVVKNVISISGASKQVVGETAAHIRRYKLPEPYKGKGIPYKGKGIKYIDEQIRRKSGKVVKGAEA